MSSDRTGQARVFFLSGCPATTAYGGIQEIRKKRLAKMGGMIYNSSSMWFLESKPLLRDMLFELNKGVHQAGNRLF